MTTTAEQKASEGTQGDTKPADTEAEAGSEPETAAGSDDDSDEGMWGAGGLSPDEAERLSAEFKAPWEDVDAGWDVDERSATQGSASEGSAGDSSADQGTWTAGDGAGAQAARASAAAAYDDEAPTVRQPAPSAAAQPTRPAPEAGEPVPAVPTLKAGRTVWIVAGVLGLALVVGLVAALAGGDGEPTETVAEGPAQSDEGSSDEDEGSSAEGEGTAGASADEGSADEGAGGQTASSDTEAQAADEGTTDTPQEPATVQVTLRTEPAGATLQIDGEQVENPYEAEVEQSDDERRVVAEMTGYEAAETTVRFDGDVSETLALEPEPEPEAQARSSASPEPRQQQQRRQQRTRQRQRPSSSSSKSAGFVTDNPY